MWAIVLTAPSHWANYLINADPSGLTDEEQIAIGHWLGKEALGYPVSCEDVGFMHWHDAWNYSPHAANCSTYTFIKRYE